MTSPADIEIQAIHNAFCEATGVKLRLGIGEYSRERQIADFLRAGFTKEDMLLVVKHLKREIEAGERRIGALKFSNIFFDLGKFEEECQQAKAQLRRKKPQDALGKAMATLRPTYTQKPATGQARPIGDLIKELRKAAE